MSTLGCTQMFSCCLFVVLFSKKFAASCSRRGFGPSLPTIKARDLLPVWNWCSSSPGSRLLRLCTKEPFKLGAKELKSGLRVIFKKPQSCLLSLFVSCLSRELERKLRCRTCVFEQQRVFVFLFGDVLDTREESLDNSGGTCGDEADVCRRSHRKSWRPR